MAYLWLNALPILLAGLAGAVPLGLLWRLPGAIALGVLSSIWIAAILAGALLIAPVPTGVWVVTLVTPVILWIGFILPALLASMSARGVAWSRTLADSAAWLAALLLQASVLRLVGLTPLT
jgi:hypothetical protein